MEALGSFEIIAFFIKFASWYNFYFRLWCPYRCTLFRKLYLSPSGFGPSFPLSHDFEKSISFHANPHLQPGYILKIFGGFLPPLAFMITVGTFPALRSLVTAVWRKSWNTKSSVCLCVANQCQEASQAGLIQMQVLVEAPEAIKRSPFSTKSS